MFQGAKLNYVKLLALAGDWRVKSKNPYKVWIFAFRAKQLLWLLYLYVLGYSAKVKAVTYLTSDFSTRCMEKTAFRYAAANTYKQMRIEPSSLEHRRVLACILLLCLQNLKFISAALCRTL